MRAWLGRKWAWAKGAVVGAWRYMAERPVRLAAFGGAILGGAIAGAPVGDAAYDYMWRDPYFCDDCHVHDYADQAWGRSVHAGVTTCHDCHLVPVSHYPVMTVGTILNPPSTPEEVKNAHVASVICEACHLAASTHELTGPMTPEMRTRVVKIDESPLHRLHMDSPTRDPGTYLGANHGTGDPHGGATADEGGGDEGHGGHGDEGAIKCLDCHGSGGDDATHRFSAARANCLACHGGIDVEVGRLTELRCRECHFTGFVGRPGVEAPTVQ